MCSLDVMLIFVQGFKTAEAYTAKKNYHCDVTVFNLLTSASDIWKLRPEITPRSIHVSSRFLYCRLPLPIQAISGICYKQEIQPTKKQPQHAHPLNTLK